MSRRNTFRQLQALAERHNFSYEGQTRRGHHVWRHRATGRIVHTVSSPTDWRAIKNCERDFKGVTHGQYADTH